MTTMFFDRKTDRLRMLGQLTFTSKAALKQQCLIMSGGNIREAKELYDFLIEDMPNLPDIDPAPVTWQDSTKNTVNDVMGWIKENKDTLAQGIDFVRGVFSRGSVFTSPAAEPLEPINES